MPTESFGPTQSRRPMTGHVAGRLSADDIARMVEAYRGDASIRAVAALPEPRLRYGTARRVLEAAGVKFRQPGLKARLSP